MKGKTVKDTFRIFDYGRMDRRTGRLTAMWMAVGALLLLLQIGRAHV